MYALCLGSALKGPSIDYPATLPDEDEAPDGKGEVGWSHLLLGVCVCVCRGKAERKNQLSIRGNVYTAQLVRSERGFSVYYT